MKVTIIAAYYPPENAASITLDNNTIEWLIKHGVNVEIIAPMPVRGIDRSVRKEYKNKRLETLHKGQLVIRRIYIPFDEDGSTLRRTLRYLLMTLFMFFKALRCRGDVVFISSTPPTYGLLAAWVNILARKPIVYNLQDIFPDSLIHTGISTNKFILWLGRCMERFIYKHVTRIIAISEDMKRNIMTKGVPEEKIDLIYNWVDGKTVCYVDRQTNPLFDRFQLARDDFYVLYAGNLGYEQPINTLIDAAKLLEGYKDIKILIFGVGVKASKYKQYAMEVDAQNVQFFPIQPPSEVSFVYSLGDVGIVLFKKGMGNYGMPSKTWSIMSTERPVISSYDMDSDLQRIIMKFDAGIAVEPEDADALISAILYVYKHRSRGLEMGKNGRRFIMNRLSKELGAESRCRACLKAISNTRGSSKQSRILNK